MSTNYTVVKLERVVQEKSKTEKRQEKTEYNISHSLVQTLWTGHEKLKSGRALRHVHVVL